MVILVQQSESPFLHFDTFRATGEAMRAVGFTETQALLFPQCVYPSGLWSATLACSQSLTKYRVKDAEKR
jgi:spermidine synthase